MASFPWFRFSLFATGAAGFGYVLMKLTVPTEEELYNRMAPDLQRKVDRTRAARLEREAAMQRQVTAQSPSSNTDPDSTKPNWADKPNK
ncbi:hypothetical protein C8J56DRAFT_232475 [Mycena floridula]|nr:hypothetical protein C8J56DRAFT_232475 [Mycena floridula]